jgi:hypothetical protein
MSIFIQRSGIVTSTSAAPRQDNDGFTAPMQQVAATGIPVAASQA